MNKFWIVLFHTYLTKLRTKSFIISTIIMLLLTIGLTNLPKLLDLFDKKDSDVIGVIDLKGSLYEPFKAQVNTVNHDLKLKVIEDETKAKKLVADKKLTGFIILDQDASNMPQGFYKANSLSDSSISNDLASALTGVKSNLAARELKLTPQQIANISSPAGFKKAALEKDAKTEEELNQARGLVYILLFVIYFSVLMYSNMIAMEVATEKTSRVMEILISSVSPVQQMFAKIIGIALLSITQMILFFGVGYFFIKQNLGDLNGGFFSFFGFGSTSISTVIYAIIFVLLGYFLYATLAAFLGSMVSRIEDVQQMTFPMTILVVMAFMIAMSGLSNPSASYVTVTSFIPFFSPMIMFLRVGMISVPFWQVAVSILILIVSIAVLAIFGGRVYRGGVLMYGSSKSLKDIKKAIQITKNT
ncbi:ABC transporter permease [Actinomycetes bacterium NPDC127524]